MDLTIAVHFLEEDEECVQVPRRHLREISNVLQMPTNQFVANFRVSKEIFGVIMGVMQHKWAPGYRSMQIRPDIKLATFLRFVATGSYQQSLGNERFSSIGKSTVGRIISECLQLFEDWICPEWIQMPIPGEEKDIMEAFFDSTEFPAVIGCVDGTHIRIKSPGDDVKALYYNRKGYYSINAMINCDHNLKIMFVDARNPGSYHGSFIWEHNEPNHRLQNDFDAGKLNAWVLGDGGYKLKPFLMTPFRSPKDAVERRYNKKHAIARNVVERCFGVLKNRYRSIIGSRGMHYRADKATQIINACCALHNICIKYKFIEKEYEAFEVTEQVADDEEIEEVDSRAVALRRNIAINL